MKRLKVGGPVDAGQYAYIERKDFDDRLLALLLEGEYANVLTPRQMGKTSLTFRTITALNQQGVRTAYVDMSTLKNIEGGVRAYFRALLTKLKEELKLDFFDLEAFSQLHADDAPGQWLQRFFREIVAHAMVETVVVFLDEIDSTLEYPYTDSLFTSLRAMYNERTLRPEYRQFTFCLLGVATPNELIKDRRSTAYNIGETLNLRDFDPAMDDLSPLASQLSDQDEQGRGLLSQVLYWTGGQPYLTAKLCRDMRFNQTIDGQGVDALVQTEFNSLARLETQDVHFEPMTRFLKTRLGTPAESLELYRRILSGERMRDQTAQAFIELKLSGLVKRDGEGFLVVRNPIYRNLFNADWIAGSEPMQALNKFKRRYRRVKTALWLVSSAALVALAVLGWREWQQRQPIHTEGAAYWADIPAGGFCMGSRLADKKPKPNDRCANVPIDPDAQADETPPHWVDMPKPFRLAKYETTIEEFMRFVNDTGRRPPPDYGFGQGLSDPQRNKLPVVGVSWQDAQSYADWLSRKTGRHYHLPTEAEWEYAARAGTQTPRYWVGKPDQACHYANGYDLTAKEKLNYPGHSIPCQDGYVNTAPVGRFQPNAWGLFDMSGNVWEWTCSAYTEQYDGTESVCNDDASKRGVLRGGSWYNLPALLRSAYRYWTYRGRRIDYLGFRLAQDI